MDLDQTMGHPNMWTINHQLTNNMADGDCLMLAVILHPLSIKSVEFQHHFSSWTDMITDPSGHHGFTRTGGASPAPLPAATLAPAAAFAGGP